MSDLSSLVEIADYHTDARGGLGLYFSNSNPTYTQRFATYLPSEINTELIERISETDKRSTLVVLARIEAALRRDYLERCNQKMSDNVSIEFRKIHKKKGRWARLDEDILDVWYQSVDPPSRKVISALRGMLKFRHWLAHGRYWNAGAKYSFQDAFFLAQAILASLPLKG